VLQYKQYYRISQKNVVQECRVLHVNLGKKGGDQPGKPEKSGTEKEGSEAKQAGPSHPQQQQPQQQQPQQQQKKKKKGKQEPAPPPQLGAVGGSDARSSQQTEKQKQPVPSGHPHPQQSAESPSGYVGARGFGRGQPQPDKGQAGMIMRTFLYHRYCHPSVYIKSFIGMMFIFVITQFQITVRLLSSFNTLHECKLCNM
jgi:hypothetical protein